MNARVWRGARGTARSIPSYTLVARSFYTRFYCSAIESKIDQLIAASKENDAKDEEELRDFRLARATFFFVLGSFGLIILMGFCAYPAVKQMRLQGQRKHRGPAPRNNNNVIQKQASSKVAPSAPLHKANFDGPGRSAASALYNPNEKIIAQSKAAKGTPFSIPTRLPSHAESIMDVNIPTEKLDTAVIPAEACGDTNKPTIASLFAAAAVIRGKMQDEEEQKSGRDSVTTPARLFVNHNGIAVELHDQRRLAVPADRLLGWGWARSLEGGFMEEAPTNILTFLARLPSGAIACERHQVTAGDATLLQNALEETKRFQSETTKPAAPASAPAAPAPAPAPAPTQAPAQVQSQETPSHKSNHLEMQVSELDMLLGQMDEPVPDETQPLSKQEDVACVPTLPALTSETESLEASRQNTVDLAKEVDDMMDVAL